MPCSCVKSWAWSRRRNYRGNYETYVTIHVQSKTKTTETHVIKVTGLPKIAVVINLSGNAPWLKHK